MNLQTLETTHGASPYDEYGLQIIIDRQPGVAFTGGSPANAVLQFSASNVTGPGVFAISVGDAAPQSVALAIGDTAAQTAAKLLAIGLTATVTGTISTGTGKTQSITGSGNILTIGGVAVDLTTPESVATLVGRIKTANPTRTTLSGTGTITPGLEGAAAGVAFTQNGSPGANFVGATGNYGIAVAYTENGVRKISPTQTFAMVNGQFPPSGSVRIDVAGATNFQWYLSDGPGSATLRAVSTANNGTSQIYAPITAVPANTQPPAPVIGPNTPASVSITLTDNSSAGNVADLPVAGAGYTSISTPPGGSGGIVVATTTAPANTPVSAAFVSGTGYSSSLVTAGTDGRVKPIFCEDFTTDLQEMEDWVSQNAEGTKEEGYSAVVRQWTTVSGNLKPDYDLLFWKFLVMFGKPVAETPVTVNGTSLVEYEFRLPSFGSVERPTFTGQWGRPDNAFRALYGIVQSMGITNAANGNTEGNMSIMLKNGTENNVMIGHGANEIQTIAVAALTAPADITIPATALGGGGNVSITVDMTAQQLRLALAAIPAIRRRTNVRVTGGVTGGNGNFTITFISQLGLTNVSPITTVSNKITITELAQGVHYLVASDPEYPILPKHWFYKQGENRAAALASAKIIDVETHEVTFADLANPHYTENQSATFRDHVDGAVTVSCNIALAFDDDPDSACAQMESDAKGWTSKKQWRIFGADAPDLLRQLRIGVYASVNASRPRGNENNVYRRNFPMTRKRNHVAGEGYSFFATLRIPPQNL